jgi:hypothetical protein
MSVIIDGYTLIQSPPPPNTDFPFIFPFKNGAEWRAPETFTPSSNDKPGDSVSYSYDYRNTFNWSGSGGSVEIYANFSFTVGASIVKPPHIPNPAHFLPQTIAAYDGDGNYAGEVPNPDYDPIPYLWYNDEEDEEIIEVQCTDISMPRRPRFLDHITLTINADNCEASGFYDMIPTGTMKYVDHLSSATTSDSAPHTTPRILTEYDITECPTRPESEIYYWTNDLTYTITYSYELTTNKGTKRTYTTTQSLFQDWTRIRDWVTQHHNNPVEFVAAPAAYSIGQIIGDSGKNTTTW